VIFVTVGAQTPFDRLVKAIDQWARTQGRSDVFAQIGRTGYRPAHIEWAPFLEPEEFKRRCAAARAIVAHAGTGSIITALQLGRPILVMPRRASLRETRNDHQLATAERFARFASVAVAWDESELAERMQRIDGLAGRPALGEHASRQLLAAIRDFIDDAAARPLGDDELEEKQKSA
jgi:UDP-N-acetylglucosamine transferase subunit ALG13